MAARASADERAAPPAGSPASVEEALARARGHGRAAAGELVAALRALLDAATLAAGSEPGRGALAPVANLLDDLEARLAGEGGGAPLVSAIAEALDVEIERWERRARDDTEARAVLRAFLGLRELLWEFGVRSQPERGAGGGRGGPRVQRVDVES